MASSSPAATPLADAATTADAAPETLLAELVESDVLVEEVSIDGMCGVY